MDAISNLFYFLIVGVLIVPSEGQLTTAPSTPVPTTIYTTSGTSSTESPTGGTTTEAPIVPGPGFPIYDDCVAYHENRCDPDSPYFIKARNAAGYEPNSDICRTQEQVPWCSGVGWTSIGIFQNYTTLGNWSYESEIWTAKGINRGFLNSQFWSANVTEICLTSAVFNIQIPVAAPSLRSLFFEKTILNMTSQQWIDSLVQPATPIFTPGCFEIGFNVGNESGASPRARLGIVSTHGAGCPEDIFALGVGLHAPGLIGSYHGYYSNQDANLTGRVFVYVRSRPVDEASSTTGPPTTGPPTTGPPTTGPPTTGPSTTGPPTTGPTAEPTTGTTAEPTTGTTAGPTTGPTAETTAGTTPGTTAGPTTGPTAETTAGTTAGSTAGPTTGTTAGPTAQQTPP